MRRDVKAVANQGSAWKKGANSARFFSALDNCFDYLKPLLVVISNNVGDTRHCSTGLLGPLSSDLIR